jgi:hypothetical protein
LHNTINILGKKSRCRGWLIREEMYIELHPDNVKLKDRHSLSMSWKSLIHLLKKWKQHILSKDETV